MTTKGAEEEIEQAKSLRVEPACDMNELCLELQQAETELREWDDWCNSGVFSPTGVTGAGEEEEAETANLCRHEGHFPVTPAILQNTPLSVGHLPSANNLVRFAESSSENAVRKSNRQKWSKKKLEPLLLEL